MPTTLKFVQIFKSNGGYGWSELHYRVSPSVTPNLSTQLAEFFVNVALPRAQLLGEDCQLVGARVSYPRDGAVASKSVRASAGGMAGKPGASPSLSLAINWTDSTFTKTKILHLRGFWDAVEGDEYYDPNGAQAEGWTDRLDIWKAALVAGGYGWPSKDPNTSAKGTVSNYAVAASGIVTFTLGGVGMPLATVGTQQQIRFSKLNRSQSVLNRSILCNVVSQNSVTSVAPYAAGAFVSGGRFNYRATSFVPYNSVNTISLGRRQMGKSSFLLAARSKARPTT